MPFQAVPIQLAFCDVSFSDTSGSCKCIGLPFGACPQQSFDSSSTTDLWDSLGLFRWIVWDPKKSGEADYQEDVRKERKCCRALFGYVKLPDCKSCCLDLTMRVRKEMFHAGKASQLNLVILFYRCASSNDSKTTPWQLLIRLGHVSTALGSQSPLPCANLLRRAPVATGMWPLSTSKSPPFRCPPGLDFFQSTLCHTKWKF